MRAEDGLVVLVLGLVLGEELTADLLGPEMLGPPGGVVGDHRVRSVEDRLGRPVVLLEHDHGGVRERLFEADQVAVVRAPEAVDRLVVVPDHHDVARFGAEEPDELPLRGVGVLELVDEHVRESVLPPGERFGVILEQTDREQQEIVEVDRGGLEEAALILAVDLGVPLLGFGRRRGERLVRPDEVVLQRRDPGVKLAGWEPFRVQVEIAPHIVGEPHRVRLVVDGERRPQADPGRLPAQDPGARRMEGRDPHPVGDGSDQRRDALLHLPRGLVRERDGEQIERRDPSGGDQIRDAVREDSGLPGAGTGDDQERTVGRGGGLALHRVEAGEELLDLVPFLRRRCGRGGDVSHDRAIVPLAPVDTAQVFGTRGAYARRARARVGGATAASGSSDVRIGSDLEQQRDRPVVDEFDRHVGAEPAGGHGGPELAERVGEGRDEWFGERGRRRRGPGGSAPPPRVAVEGELTHDERGSGGLSQRPVHHPVVVGEDAELPDLLGQPPGSRLIVAVGDADEHAQAGPDLADDGTVDPDSGLGDPLDEGPHDGCRPALTRLAAPCRASTSRTGRGC